LDAKKSREGTGFEKPLTIAHHNHQRTSGGRVFLLPWNGWKLDWKSLFRSKKKGPDFHPTP
jgi:hypothetical protein